MFKKLTLFTFLFVLIDQVIKSIVTFNMSVFDSITVIKNFFNITYVQNKGAAFSILEGHSWLFIILAIVALNLIYFFFLKEKELEKYEVILYSLLISGILGNLIDRVMFGYVIDFLDFTIFGYDFAIFNLADTFIVISVIIIVILSFLEEKNEVSNRRRK